MKVLIVQGICTDNVPPGEMKNFWNPCMDTVRKWAGNRGWDYKLFTERRNDDFNISTWEQFLIPGRETISQNQFYKFQWMDGWDNYDHVYWLDSDCYIYGDPAPFALDIRSNHPAMSSCNFLNSSTLLGRWKRPNMSTWGGKQSEVQKAIDWARYQFEHPDDQEPLLQVLKTINSTPCGDDHCILNFTEEILLAAYTHPREGAGVNIVPFDEGFSASGTDSWKPDTIVHFGGANKLRKLTKLRVYRAYMGYLEKHG